MSKEGETKVFLLNPSQPIHGLDPVSRRGKEVVSGTG